MLMKHLAFAATLLASVPAFATCPTYSTIVDVGSVPLQVDTADLVTVPPTGGASGSGYHNVIVQPQLTTAIKEATGNTLYLEADYSLDNGVTWNYQASIDWVSYGAPYTAHLPGACTILDPDPTLNIPIHAGSIYRLQYKAHGFSSAHPVFLGQ
jgi:hypothetical protein